jgi:ABC-type iron transport system FetAB ATPase subunit
MTTSENNTILALKCLAVVAGGVRLLENIDLDLRAGELVAITGPSGSGKTSLLRTVSGLVDPLEGEVLFEDRPAGTDGWPAYRRRVVLMDQRPALLEAGVRKNLERPFSYASAGKPFPAQRAKELLEKFGLGGIKDGQDARSLSVGEQQRLCLIRALLVEPAVMLMDEPTSALDKDAAADVERLIKEEAGACYLAALIVTHDEAQAARLCDRSFDIRAYMADREACRTGFPACQ